MFVALDRAVRRKLTGFPTDRKGRPENPTTAPGIRVRTVRRGNDRRDSGFSPFGLVQNHFTQVLVFNKTTDGLDWEQIFPCVTFDVIHFEPNLDVWLPPTEIICKPDPSGSDLQVFNQYGDLVAEGKSNILTRPLPEGWDVMYQITVHSKIEYEAYEILRAIVLLLPQKGFITVDQADGSQLNLDMLMQDGIEVIEAETPAVVEGDIARQGEFRYREYALTYLVEAYIDTTFPELAGSAVPITAVELEMTFTDEPDADNLTTQNGVIEVIDLTDFM